MPTKEPGAPPQTPMPTDPSSATAPRSRHVFLTRFNVRWDEASDGASLGNDPTWLSGRFELFERYCLPSMLAQSTQDFSWIIFFDHQTPEPFATRARALAQVSPNIIPVFCKSLPLEFVQATIVEQLPERPEWLLTTRLDNDDGLHSDFAATLQARQSFELAEVLNFAQGVVLCGERVYRWRHVSNAFISLSEPFAERRTVFSIARHLYAAESYPVRQIAEPAAWLQVIHGGNISNRVRGRRVLWADVVSGFPALATVQAPSGESAAAVLLENLTLDVVRGATDLARVAVRRGAKLMGIDVRRKAALKRARRVAGL
jgi:hypothetical protein